MTIEIFSMHPIKLFQAWADQHLPKGWDDGIGHLDRFDAIRLVAKRAGFREISADEVMEDTLREFREWWMSK